MFVQDYEDYLNIDGKVGLLLSVLSSNCYDVISSNLSTSMLNMDNLRLGVS